MADQTLVPKGLPQGERQRMVEARQRAGLSLDPQTTSQSASNMVTPSNNQPGQTRSVPRFDPLTQATPDEFPTAGLPQGEVPRPMQATMSAQDYAFDLASRSNNGLLRSVAARRGATTPQV